MYHHDSRTYDIAASEAATYFRAKFEKLIEAGQASATRTIEHVLNVIPEDRIATARAITFDANGHLRARVGDATLGVHEHAKGQICTALGMPRAYVEALSQEGPDHEWRRQLLAHNLNTLSAHTDSRHLVRSVAGEIRGFLSDRYRRLDSRPLLEQFVDAIIELGAAPLEGYATDTKVAIKAVLPHIFEPIPNEVMVLGLQWSNSDFGAGTHCISMFVLRGWCTNKATCQNELRQVHLGRRLAEDVEFSERTYALDTQAQASAVGDIVRGSLGPEKVNALLGKIRALSETEIREFGAGAWGRKLASALTKAEHEKARDAFEGADTHLLPPGKTAWRLSNAISWVANGIKSEDRKMELERLAGEIIAG